MTKAEIFKQAHELTRKELKGRFASEYRNYSHCFAETLKAIYATIKYEAECDAKWGKGMRPGFQIIEPKVLWA